jgi:hypothetical protein
MERLSPGSLVSMASSFEAIKASEVSNDRKEVDYGREDRIGDSLAERGRQF